MPCPQLNSRRREASVSFLIYGGSNKGKKEGNQTRTITRIDGIGKAGDVAREARLERGDVGAMREADRVRDGPGVDDD